MASRSKFYIIREVYGGDWTRSSFMHNFFNKFIYHKYYHRLCGSSLEYWAPEIPAFREAICIYVCLNEDSVKDIDVPLEQFRIFGWIECAQNFTCQLGSGPCNEDYERKEEFYDIQRAFYTAYGKDWGIKTQAISLLNEMLGSGYFTSIAQNDKGMVNIFD